MKEIQLILSKERIIRRDLQDKVNERNPVNPVKRKNYQTGFTGRRLYEMKLMKEIQSIRILRLILSNGFFSVFSVVKFFLCDFMVQKSVFIRVYLRLKKGFS